jgi:hypothetical protein
VAPYEHWEYFDPRVRQIEQDHNYALNKTKKVREIGQNVKKFKNQRFFPGFFFFQGRVVCFKLFSTQQSTAVCTRAGQVHSSGHLWGMWKLQMFTDNGG